MDNLSEKDEIYDEKNGLYYTKIGDYYYPNIVAEDTEKVTLGKYGRARLRYLKEHKKVLYNELLMTGKLPKHLQEIDSNAEQKVKIIIHINDKIKVTKKGKIKTTKIGYFFDTKIII